MFLFSNLLEEVPGEIANLEHLAVLSLRNNRARELPLSVGRLRSLEELNIAGNRIRWLPWELLTLLGPLGKLRNLNVAPNPLFIPLRPTQGSCRLDGELEDVEAIVREMEERSEEREGSADADNIQRLRWIREIYRQNHQRTLATGDSTARREPIYIASTTVTHFAFDGSSPRSLQLPPSRIPHDPTRPFDPHLLPPSSEADMRNYLVLHDEPRSTVPSLFESVLRSASKYEYAAEVEKVMSEDLPENIRRGVQLARRATEQGGTRCSVCEAAYVVARAEWVEYWHCPPDTDECAYDSLFLPFLRRTCSWTCADAVCRAGQV